MHAWFGFFLTWWGAVLLAALDTSVFFFLPFGNDALVVYLAARHRSLFWLYPILTTVGSVAGAAVTYWIGHEAGEAGLPKLVAKRQLDRLKRRVRNAGAAAMAVPAALPPPFPLTPFILTCGALDVNRWRLFVAFTAARILRFGVEAVLARRYGERVVLVLESHAFQYIVAAFIVVTLVGTTASAVMLWRRTRRARGRPGPN